MALKCCFKFLYYDFNEISYKIKIYHLSWSCLMESHLTPWWFEKMIADMTFSITFCLDRIYVNPACTITLIMIFSLSWADARDKSSKIGPAASKLPVHVHIPPELLYILDVKRDVLKSLYLLPSLMYRIESLMLSSQLREEIDGQTSKFNIRSSLVCSIYDFE